MEFFAKIVKSYNYFVLCDKYSEPCLLSNIQTYSRIFMSYSEIFRHFVAYLELCVTLEYSDPCHIQNPGIFRTQGIFRTLSRHTLAYSERFVRLAYWEPCHIQNFGIFRILAYLGPEAYSESCLFSHIQVYSDIFNNDSYNSISLPFFNRISRTYVFLWKQVLW